MIVGWIFFINLKLETHSTVGAEDSLVGAS